MLKDYRKIEDLLTDDSFLGWYHRTNEQDIVDWDQWISIHPNNKKLAQEATLFMDSLKMRDTAVSATQIANAESRIMDRLNISEPAKKISQGFWVQNRLRIAAVCIIVILSAIVMQQAFVAKSAVKTNYGEMKMQILPDGTEVLLNANSQVSYSENWKEGQDRNVWIVGEAFFHVKKTVSHSRFIVHTKQFDIHVTGTQFNVMDRHDRSNVLLEEGQVILRRTTGSDIVMAPGDFLEFTNKGLEKKKINNENVIAWKDKKIVFDNTLLSDAIETIREHYGVTVSLSDDSLGNSRLTGMLPNDNLDVLIEALGALNEFKVVHEKDQIIIKRANSRNID